MAGPQTIDFGTKVVLTGSVVTLRPVAVDDVPALHAAMTDREVRHLTGSIHSWSEAQVEDYTVAQLVPIYRRWTIADDRIVWTIVERSTGCIVGESVLNDLDVGNRSCGFRIWISMARDRGLGTEATRLSIQHAFDLGVHRVELEVYPFNPRARHVYEKVGFVHEGTKRHALLFEGQWVDAHLMSCLSTDWGGCSG